MRVTALGVGDAFDPNEVNSASTRRARRVHAADRLRSFRCGAAMARPPRPGRDRRGVPDPSARRSCRRPAVGHGTLELGGPPQGAARRHHGTGQDAARPSLRHARHRAALSPCASPAPAQAAARSAPSRCARRRRSTRSPTTPLRSKPAVAASPTAATDGRPASALALYADADLLMHECWEPAPAPDITFHADLETVRAIAGPAPHRHLPRPRRPPPGHAGGGCRRPAPVHVAVVDRGGVHRRVQALLAPCRRVLLFLAPCPRPNPSTRSRPMSARWAAAPVARAPLTREEARDALARCCGARRRPSRLAPS